MDLGGSTRVEHVFVASNIHFYVSKNYDVNIWIGRLGILYDLSHVEFQVQSFFNILLYFVKKKHLQFCYGDVDGNNYDDGDDIGTSMWNWEPLADPSQKGLTTFLQS